MTSIEQLYKDFGVLADAKDKAGEHEEAYLSILNGVNGGSSEKRLASQFMARFFKYFPQLSERAIDAQLDLCEDEDVAIRKQAIKDLVTLCKSNPEHVPRISDVLTQLLQSEDSNELSLVTSSLLNLFSFDAKGTFQGIFSQILNGEDTLREKAIKFLQNKVKQIPEEIMTKEVEEFVLEESKKVLVDVTGDEFLAFMQMLSVLKCCQTVLGRQQLVELITEQADMESADGEFSSTDVDCVDKLLQCTKQGLPFFSKNVHSTKFVAYFCDKVLPKLSETASPDDDDTDYRLELVKVFAEMSTTCGDMENLSERLEKLYDCLLEYMPLPPLTEDGENTPESEQPKLEFSYVESLMFAFHQIARKEPQFLTGEENAERLKDFRLRLQYFARGIQVYIKQLRMALQGKTGEALKTEESKLKVTALKITNNINVLIKDLFHNPPSYKAVISLSWKPVQKAPTAIPTSPAGQKRGAQGDGDVAAKKSHSHTDRVLYHPPGGKFSEKAGTFTQNRGRGRGGFRGRGGRNRNWRGRY
ncbi:apoptosis inhibitor 5-like [Lingula anatina]|uniref:Apoptosis inhibitor 5-like n=1 Tax=Lingula anatina TaxID=7574 RepID=A0A1S3H697_LINAN|nr:apoptosis inhibitor 5-like [Lingula anatina]|eukprot:XP_013381640.1 apoptosis inhibitor 5-like [Lingula anatina]